MSQALSRTLTRLVVVTSLAAVSLTAAASDLWRDISEQAIPNVTGRTLSPRAYRTLALDQAALSRQLASAPAEELYRSGTAGTVLELPMPDGTYQRFAVFEISMMEPGLASKFPELRTYRGQGLDEPGALAVLDTTPEGFHGMILRSGGTVFIDPYQRKDSRHYISYFRNDYQRPLGSTPFRCDFEAVNPGTLRLDESTEPRPSRASMPVPSTPSGATLRTYRLALAGTGEYTTAVCGGSPAVACGLAAMVTSVNRVTGVYEKDVAIRMVLIANNDLLVYTNGAADPYTNNDGFAMLSQNQTNVDNVIGSANYDFGHVFSTGGGGVASLGVPCVGGSKARGVTGSPNPTGDAFDIDYVAHEMGHQFGAYHTFNGTTGSCGGGNRSSSAAYEPGSGTTIMAYAGICGAENIQNNSDAYFHVKSLDQILQYSTGGSGNTCPTQSATGNGAPTVNAGGSFTIPMQTPFTMTGSATDPNGDPLVYCWEEYDLGTAAPPNDDVGAERPIFRSYTPVSGTSRTFPKLADILNNTSTLGEALPARTRTMTFRLTARDNKAGGGGLDWASTTVNVTSTAGPFRVTTPTTGTTWPGGTLVSVGWNVANTSSSPVSCANVKISFSSDGGNTFPTTLSASTANDGAEQVTAPNLNTTTARVKVECVGNIFFHISSGFSVTAGGGNNPPTITPQPGGVSVQRGAAASNLQIATVSDLETPAGSLAVTVVSAPAGIGVTNITNTSGTIRADVSAICPAPLGSNTVTLRVNDGTYNVDAALTVNVTADAVVPITAPSSVCANSTGNAASVTPVSGATYTWGITNGTITGGTGTNAITFTAGASGSVGLTIAITSPGCSTNGSKSVTIAPPDPGPSAAVPANGATGYTGSTLSWTFSGAGPYQVLYDTQNPPEKRLAATNSTSVSLPIWFPSTTYYWRVSGTAACGTAQSAVYSFTTGACPFTGAAPALTAPSNGAGAVATSTTLTWTTVAGTAHYDVYLGTTNPPTQRFRSVGSTTSSLSVKLNPATTYYWKVLAHPVCGATGAASSSVSSFTTQTSSSRIASVTPAFVNKWTGGALEISGTNLSPGTVFCEREGQSAGTFSLSSATPTLFSGTLNGLENQRAGRYDIGISNFGVERGRLVSGLAVRSFSDVVENDYYYESSDRVVNAGIMEADFDGVTAGPQFAPLTPVSRAEMAEYLAKAYQWWRTGSTSLPAATCVPSGAGSTDFPDVSCSHPRWLYIHWIKVWGVTIGSPCAEGLCFLPANTLSRAEMVTFLDRLKQGTLLSTLLSTVGEIDPGCAQPWPTCSGWTDPVMQTAGYPRRESNVAFVDRLTVGCAGAPGAGLTMCATNNVIRAEIAEFLARAIGLVPNP
ncbi:MAG: M12 family metallo-peptidase [Thermoanaerobaculia bacterium]|nr:M12 family metallo-peptidase [Thermoanaerobaculia bacterium]